MFDPSVIGRLMACVSFPAQDANVRLIRELREEIDRLKSMLLSFQLVGLPLIVGAWRQLSCTLNPST